MPAFQNVPRYLNKAMPVLAGGCYHIITLLYCSNQKFSWVALVQSTFRLIEKAKTGEDMDVIIYDADGTF